MQRSHKCALMGNAQPLVGSVPLNHSLCTCLKNQFTEQLLREACTQPDWSLRIQQAVRLSTWRSLAIARSTFSSRRMHGEYFAPRWIRSA